MLRLYSQSLKVYKDPSDYSSKLYEISVREIFNESLTINDAIDKNIITSDWNSNFSPKPIDSCCFVIFVKNPVEPKK